jgi:hypothetical protein
MLFTLCSVNDQYQIADVIGPKDRRIENAYKKLKQKVASQCADRNEG